MSRWCALVAIAACASPPRYESPPLTVSGGTLVDVTEGTTVVVETSVEATVVSGPGWARVDPNSEQLTLSPDCTAAPGIDGPSAHYSLEIAPFLTDGAPVDMDIEVQPSAAGICTPSLFGNVANAPACPATWPGPPQSVYNLGHSTVPLNFSGPDNFDRVLYLDVDDPDRPDDPQVLSRVTSDAPLEYTVYGNPNYRCAPIPNAGITGQFELDYVIAKDASSPILSAGSWSLEWEENHSFGIEIHSCASSTGTCVKDQPNKYGPPYYWCVGKAAGASVTLMVNVWANKQTSWVPPIDATLAAQLSSASVVGLIGPDQEVIGSTMPSLPIHFGDANNRTPIPVSVDLAQAQPGDHLILQLTSPLIDPNVVTTEVDLLTAPSTCP